VFDSRILVKVIIANNMLSELQSVLTGFIDTLPMLKKLLEVPTNKKNWRGAA